MKTTKEHIESAAKYSGSSLTISLAVTQIIVFMFPNLIEIKEPIFAILAFVGNLLMVYLVKS